MTIIYITENNCECYAVTLQNKGWVKVQKFKDGVLMKILYTRSIRWKYFWVKAKCVQ